MAVALGVMVGGSLGALARYGADAAIEHRADTIFPLSTFAINVSGCFAAGIAVAALVDRHDAPSWVRVGLVVGFLGAYTTYSTFAQETLDLTEARHVAFALVNVFGSVVVGVAAVCAGTILGRAL